MDDIKSDMKTCRELIQELLDMPPDAPVMIAVVKYPEEFAMRRNAEGVWSWADSTDVEVVPIDREEVIILQDGCVTIAVELADYSEQRHFAGG